MTRHPITGELIEDTSKWRGADGTWHPVEVDKEEKNEKGEVTKRTYKPVTPKPKEEKTK